VGQCQVGYFEHSFMWTWWYSETEWLISIKIWYYISQTQQLFIIIIIIIYLLLLIIN